MQNGIGSLCQRKKNAILPKQVTTETRAARWEYRRLLAYCVLATVAAYIGLAILIPELVTDRRVIRVPLFFIGIPVAMYVWLKGFGLYIKLRIRWQRYRHHVRDRSR